MKKIKRAVPVFCLLIAVSMTGLGQAKKPILMVLPSDNWCIQRFFVTEFDNMGTKVKVPDYKM